VQRLQFCVRAGLPYDATFLLLLFYQHRYVRVANDTTGRERDGVEEGNARVEHGIGLGLNPCHNAVYELSLRTGVIQDSIPDANDFSKGVTVGSDVLQLRCLSHLPELLNVGVLPVRNGLVAQHFVVGIAGQLAFFVVDFAGKELDALLEQLVTVLLGKLRT
jgi:hypothetical protein